MNTLTTPPRPHTPPRVPSREVASYCVGAVGSNVIYALVATYLMVYYTESFGLKALAVGTLFLVVRIWDAITDVMMGIIVDNTNTRWGRFRPFLLVGGFITAVTSAACFFSPSLSDAGKLIYAYFTYIAWSMAYTSCDIPFWSLTPAMTDDPQDRTRIVSASRTAAQVGYWIVYVGALPLVGFFGNWFIVGILAGVIGFAGFLVAFFGVKERCVLPRHEPQTVKAVVHLFGQNAPLRYLMTACLLLEAVSAIRGTFGVYYFKYYLHAEKSTPIYLGITITMVIAGCLAAPALARRFGKVPCALYAYVIVGVLTMLMYFVRDNVNAIFVLAGFIGFFDGVSNVARMSCLADCVEYGEWKTGNRAEGMVFSTNVFKTKLSGAISGALAAYLLAGIGFVANQAQAESTLNWMVLFFTLILGAGSIAAIMPLFKYELTESRFAQIVAELHRRKST